MLAGIHLLLGQCLAGIDLGQAAILVVTIFRCFAFFALVRISRNEAVETDDRTDGAEACLITLVVGEDLDRRALDFRRGHLARDAALPDQVVKAHLVCIEEAPQLVWRAIEIGRTNGFVRFLGVLRLGRIEARLLRHVARSELVEHGGTGSVDGFRCHLHTVGTHIGNETDSLAADIDTFIKLLGDLHGARRREAEL